MKYIKYIFLPAFIIASIAGLIVFRNLDARAEIYVGYMTKIMCSEHFVAGRNVEDIRAQDFFGIDPAVERINISVDSSSGKVTGNVFGVLGRSAAQYRADAGCTPAARGGVEPVKIPKPDPLPHRFEEYIRPDIQAIVDAAIGDTGPEAANRTRALLVLQDGKIVGEAYGNGFDKHIPMQSWSMAKTVTAMLVGVLIDDGRLDIHRQNLFREWTDDDRVNIQLNHLLRMESGLDAHEVYDATSDVVQMLFRDRNTGTFAINKPLESQPGEVFEYSSATTSLISHLLRQTLGDNAYQALPQKALFDPLGMSSTVFETDASGNFIGSSFIYATARDYARLGQLYLNGGTWGDRQILSEDWIEYTTTPTEASNGHYAGHIWINARSGEFPGLPETTYYFAGHEQQYVIVIPDRDAVIVRLGITRPPADPDRDLHPYFARIYAAL